VIVDAVTAAERTTIEVTAAERTAAEGTTAGPPPDRPRFRSHPIADTFPLIFDSERIRLEVIGDSLEVRGDYVLLCRSRTEDRIALFYPFPRDSLLGGARMVSLRFRPTGRSAAGESSSGSGPGLVEAGAWEELPGGLGVRWWIPPCSTDTLVAEAVYRQKLHGDYARYIVTTTKVWGRPLRKAVFDIRLPPGTEALEFSYPFAATEGGTYRYEARDFLPDRDIEVRWGSLRSP